MDNCYVLFLDVLGFSELVLNNSHEQLVKLCDSELRQTALVSTMFSSVLAGNMAVMPCDVQATQQGILHDVRQEQIHLHLMSDSLIAWTNDLAPNSLILLVNFAAQYLANTLMQGLPHRGAISKGSIKVLDLPLNGRPQSTAVGSGLVKAHRYEGGQEWMGCVIDPECINALPDDLITAWAGQDDTTLTRYAVPYKPNARHTSEFVVDWRTGVKMYGIEATIGYFTDKFGQYNKPVTVDIEAKVRNTHNFYVARYG